jgi:small multidrug resistance pump
MASCNFAVECDKRQVRCESRKRITRTLVALSWMPWIFLSVAILFEVASITSMKLSRGFAEMWPSVGVFVFYICSAIAVILALRRLELSVAYAIWSGVGTALTATIGFVYFREPLTVIKLASLALVVAGVVGLSLASKPAG